MGKNPCIEQFHKFFLSNFIAPASSNASIASHFAASGLYPAECRVNQRIISTAIETKELLFHLCRLALSMVKRGVYCWFRFFARECNSSMLACRAQSVLLVAFRFHCHGKSEHDAPRLPWQSSHKNNSWTVPQLLVPFDRWQAQQSCLAAVISRSIRHISCQLRCRCRLSENSRTFRPSLGSRFGSPVFREPQAAPGTVP